MNKDCYNRLTKIQYESYKKKRQIASKHEDVIVIEVIFF